MNELFCNHLKSSMKYFSLRTNKLPRLIIWNKLIFYTRASGCLEFNQNGNETKREG